MKKKKHILSRLGLAFSLLAVTGATAQNVDISLAQDGSNIDVVLTAQGVSYNTEIWNSLTFSVKYLTVSGVTLGPAVQPDNYSLFGGALTGNSYQASGFAPTLQTTTTDGGYTYLNYTFVSTNTMSDNYLLGGFPTGVGSNLPADTDVNILQIPVTAGDINDVILAVDDAWTETNNISYNTIIAGVDRTGNIVVPATGPFVYWVTAGGAGTQDGSSLANAAPTISALIGGAAAGDSIKIAAGTVNEPGDLTIPANVLVYAMDGSVINMGTNNLTNNGHVTIAGSAGLVQGTGSTVDGTGNFEVIRDAVQSTTQFNFLSSPIADIDVQAVFGGSNVVSFNPADQTNGLFGWSYQTSGNLGNGQGYAVNGAVTGGFSGARHYIGNLVNNGNINFALDGTAYGQAYDGYNLAGNPYPSTIDMNTFITSNADVGSITIYDQSAGMYVVYNNVNSAGLDIASGQGFFIEYTAAPAGTASFTNALRTTNGAGTIERSAGISTSVLTLTDANGDFYPTYIAFTEMASEGFDMEYDAKLIPDANEVTIYTSLDGEQQAIQSFGALTEDKTVALGMNSGAGLHTIALTQFDNFSEDVNVILVDHETGIEHNLLDGEYSFIATVDGVQDDRFDVRYERTGLNVGDLDAETLAVTYQDNNVYITGLNNDKLQGIQLHDVTGKQMGYWSDAQVEAGSATVYIGEQPVATYLVEVITDRGSKFQKINVTK